MKYTVRYCHLSTIPELSVGQVITRGDVIGVMGNTGQSTGPHLHIDLAKSKDDFISRPWKLSDMAHGIIQVDPVQLLYFIDKELFYYPLKVTSHFCDPGYKDADGNIIVHMAYDVVPVDRKLTTAHFPIHWNRTAQGAVISKGEHPGYGNYIHIGYNR